MRPKGLGGAIGKRNPFESLEEEALLSLVRTADRCGTRFGRFLRDYKLTGPQYNILRILRGEGRPLPILEVAGRMIAEAPAITGLIDRLESAGLVERKRCPVDRRVIHVAITAPALDLLSRIDAPLDELRKNLLAGLKKTELKELVRLLEKTRSWLEDDPE